MNSEGAFQHLSTGCDCGICALSADRQPAAAGDGQQPAHAAGPGAAATTCPPPTSPRHARCGPTSGTVAGTSLVCLPLFAVSGTLPGPLRQPDEAASWRSPVLGAIIQLKQGPCSMHTSASTIQKCKILLVALMPKIVQRLSANSLYAPRRWWAEVHLDVLSRSCTLSADSRCLQCLCGEVCLLLETAGVV